ncbi:MAG: hypothetical protein M2R45_04871 [Verrucomicrobia subdivision 3 bacterium]|nr:hypothetical protein [Limisphaerales bacterium]MCS1417522.1 hypothetical protein [Limisphaerales bacterium]
MMEEQIIRVAEAPHELEVLYRKDPKGFERALPGAFAEQPDSLVLQG